MLRKGLSLRERPRPRPALGPLLGSRVKLLLRLRLSRARPLRRTGERESREGDRRRDGDRVGLLDRELYGDRLRERDSTSGDRDREGMMCAVLRQLGLRETNEVSRRSNPREDLTSQS